MTDRPTSASAVELDHVSWDFVGDRNFSEVDGRVLELFRDRSLRNRLLHQSQTEIDFDKLWELSRTRLASYRRHGRQLKSELIETHSRVVQGLPGQSMLIAAAMLWDSTKEAQDFYGISARTLRARVTGVLSVQEGELAMRAGRVTETIAGVFRDYDVARRWLRTRNFALGGIAPRDLLRTGEGEQIVLNELQTQVDGGPV